MEKESSPIRPVYMSRMSRLWENMLRVGVMPVVRPTVPMAEATSKAQST